MSQPIKDPVAVNRTRSILATMALVCALIALPAAIIYCIGCWFLPSLYALAPGNAGNTPLVHPYGEPTSYLATIGALFPGVLAGIAYLIRRGPHPPSIDGRAMTAIIITLLATIAVIVGTFYYADQTNQITTRYSVTTISV